MTLVFGSFLSVLNASADSARLQDEIADARNARDALLLQPGVKADDPRVRAKTELIEEKTRALNKAFGESQKDASAPKTYPNKSPNRENGERDEPFEGSQAKSAVSPSGTGFAPSKTTATAPTPASAPETALSGEGIQSEIHYPKKKLPGKNEKAPPIKTPRLDHAEEPIPAASAAADASGLSEIQYPKKKKTP